jgi:hypothetical protein
MTKHHFEAIAQTFAAMRASGHYDMREWLDYVTAIAYTLADFNPRFDVARFMSACGACPSARVMRAPRSTI